MKHENKNKTKIGLEPTLEIEAKKSSGDVYSEIDKYSKLTHSAFYSGDKIEEKVTIRSPKEQSDLLQRKEEEIVNSLLSAYNRTHNSNYEISKGQPPQYDSTDIIIVDKTTGGSEKIQVTVSDSQAFENLARSKGILKRNGEINKLTKAALDKAINKKKDIYSTRDRQNLTLVLDGWRTVKPNNLDYYREQQQQFMADSGFKEVWFVGHTDETVLRLFP